METDGIWPFGYVSHVSGLYTAFDFINNLFFFGFCLNEKRTQKKVLHEPTKTINIFDVIKLFKKISKNSKN